MVSKKNDLKIALQVLLIFGLGYIMVYVAFFTYFWMVSIWIGLLAIYLAIRLVKHTNKYRDDLENFLHSMKQGDFSGNFTSAKQQNQIPEIQHAYQQIIEMFRNLREEKESQYQFLKAIVEHVDIALICIDSKQKVTMANKATLKLLGLPSLTRTRTIAQVSQDLESKILEENDSDKGILKITLKDKILNLVLQKTRIKLQAENYTLISLQDIKNELDVKEVESWQRLLRVLTHEITNSAIPISSLAKLTRINFENEMQQNKGFFGEESRGDFIKSLETVENRSQGLAKFVKGVKEFTSLPKPKTEQVSLNALMERIIDLWQAKLQSNQIVLCKNFPKEPILIMADPILIEQVVINVLKNSIEAVNKVEKPQIKLCTHIGFQEKVEMLITDNGPGIDEEILDQVFVPFFTTKEKGSGIGLSLAQQIMQMHKGSITLKNKEKGGTECKLVFNK